MAHYQQLTIEEREKIQIRFWTRESIRSIAQELGRSPATISRELKRHFPLEHMVYTPRLAHSRALRTRKQRGQRLRLKNEFARNYVIEKLKLRWSPEQISGKLKEEHGHKVSHEAIYQFIYKPVSSWR